MNSTAVNTHVHPVVKPAVNSIESACQVFHAHLIQQGYAEAGLEDAHGAWNAARSDLDEAMQFALNRASAATGAYEAVYQAEEAFNERTLAQGSAFSAWHAFVNAHPVDRDPQEAATLAAQLFESQMACLVANQHYYSCMRSSYSARYELAAATEALHATRITIDIEALRQSLLQATQIVDSALDQTYDACAELLDFAQAPRSGAVRTTTAASERPDASEMRSLSIDERANIYQESDGSISFGGATQERDSPVPGTDEVPQDPTSTTYSDAQYVMQLAVLQSTGQQLVPIGLTLGEHFADGFNYTLDYLQ
ncbi:hypothetical protein N0K08_16090 [Acidovorax sp. Be4]|uniref:Uncharacterized protein n=1 Tax=Acidovorax bellezanensis TaxID=2976702 RepID=A0ABT2PSI6_9BURK|nr:hypothetical protein [Acidovorax sp. Be4]MCT9812167.1 hypothetical protein [Acidovorax sp. Be4]